MLTRTVSIVPLVVPCECGGDNNASVRFEHGREPIVLLSHTCQYCGRELTAQQVRDDAIDTALALLTDGAA